MTVVDRIDWDKWRARYDAMSFREHQEFNEHVARVYPEQMCWNGDAVARFLLEEQPSSVVELGGWDGSLAAEMMPRFPCIVTWVNYDITPNVPQVCDHPGYERVALDDWPWKRKAAGDVLIASHVFEHMLMDEILWLLDEWDVDVVFADVPVGPGTPTWHGYEGTHILEVGGTEFLWRLGSNGWEVKYCDMAGGMVAHLERVP